MKKLTAAQLSRDANSPAAIARLRQETATKAFEQWVKKTSEQTGTWKLLKPVAVSANMARLEPQPDGSYLAIGDISKRDEYQFQLNLDAGTTAIMIEGLTDPSLPKRGPGRTYYEGPIGDFFLSEVKLKDAREAFVPIREAWVDFALAGREAAKSLDEDPLTGGRLMVSKAYRIEWSWPSSLQCIQRARDFGLVV